MRLLFTAAALVTMLSASAAAALLLSPAADGHQRAADAYLLVFECAAPPRHRPVPPSL